MRIGEVVNVESPWLTTKGVMKYLGVSRDWVDSRRASGELPYSFVGHTVFMKVADVDRLIMKGSVTLTQTSRRGRKAEGLD